LGAEGKAFSVDVFIVVKNQVGKLELLPPNLVENLRHLISSSTPGGGFNRFLKPCRQHF
jgi:hypothetical protein